jgi:hypothetical protein
LKLSDFFLWGQVGEEPRPPSEAGAALLALIELELLPGFVLDGPWMQELMTQGKGAKAPPRLCWAAQDAILLAPHQPDAEHWGGFLIAQSSAKGQTREFASEAGEVINLLIPDSLIPAGTLKAARANALLPVGGKTPADITSPLP